MQNKNLIKGAKIGVYKPLNDVCKNELLKTIKSYFLRETNMSYRRRTISSLPRRRVI